MARGQTSAADGEEEEEVLPPEVDAAVELPGDTDTIRAAIKRCVRKMSKIDDARDKLNTEAQAEISRLKNYGIQPAAFRAAYARSKMDASKRHVHDVSFALCCNAQGVPYQRELFDVVEQEAAATH